MFGRIRASLRPANSITNDLIWDPWEIEAKEITGLETQPRGWLMKKKVKVNLGKGVIVGKEGEGINR